jgi:copper transport protein
VKSTLRYIHVRRWPTALLLAMLLSIWPAAMALAHANLVKSDPASGSVLVQPPQAVVLEFSENIDPGFSTVQLLDAQSSIVVRGPGTVDPAQPRLLHLSLPVLPDGVYSAAWKVRSAADGHVTQGIVSFSVGVTSPLASLLPPPGTPDPATALPAPLDALLHSASFFSAAILAGSLLFGLLVWRPTLRQWDEANPAVDQATTQILKPIALIGAGVLFITTIGLMLLQAAQAPQGSWWHGLALAASGRTGVLDDLRLLLLIGLAVLAGRLEPLGNRRPGMWGLAAALGVSLLLTFSLQSHAAAQSSVLAVLFDWLHMTAVSAWIGGLLPLLLVLLRAQRQTAQAGGPPLDKLIPNFSRVALVSTTTLFLTGSYNAFIHVRTLPALVATTYGWALAAKLALFGLLLLLGAVNLLLLSPQLRRAVATAARWLRRSVPTEISLGLGALLAAGVLTTVSPAVDALTAQNNLGF